MNITTNNHPRPLIEAYELTPKERADFDYLDWVAIDAGNDSHQFFRYRHDLYDLSEFEYTGNLSLKDGPFKGWDGYISESFFSGIVIRYPTGDDALADYEYVVVGSYCS